MSMLLAKKLLAGCGVLALLSCGQLSRVSLPEIGSVGELPPSLETLRIKVMRDGRAFCKGAEVDLAQLSLLVTREVAKRSKSRFEWVECSDLYVLIDADRDVPCGVVSALLRQLCSPSLAVNRVFFGARSDATGERGALALFTPVDLGGSSRDFIHEPFRVAVGMGGGSSDPKALTPTLRSWLRERDSSWEPILVCECAEMVPLGYALCVVDSILRAGISKVAIYCESQAVEGQGGETWSSALRREGEEAGRVRPVPSIVWDGAVIGRAGDPLPPVPFRRGGFAGVPRSFRIMSAAEPPGPPVQGEQIRDDGWLPR